ncbi:MAG: molybdenum cofactor guanylyltransferase [Planctomycetota bacterium]
MTVRANLLGAVLCGGRSSRMGRDKATLRNSHGIDFLTLALERLQVVCREVCVSASADRQTMARLIADPPHSFGPISGLSAVLSVASDEGFDGCLVNPVDTPNLTAEDLDGLITIHRKSPDHPVCALSGDGDERRLQPLIAIYPVSSLPSVRECVESEQYSLRRYLESSPFSTLPLSSSSCHNINTPADIESQ